MLMLSGLISTIDLNWNDSPFALYPEILLLKFIDTLGCFIYSAIGEGSVGKDRDSLA